MIPRPVSVGRRVVDKTNGDLGTIVAAQGRGRYRIDWDDPTPYQDVASPKVPSKFITWVDTNHA